LDSVLARSRVIEAAQLCVLADDEPSARQSAGEPLFCAFKPLDPAVGAAPKHVVVLRKRR
jgi:hypothetical protein